MNVNEILNLRPNREKPQWVGARQLKCTINQCNIRKNIIIMTSVAATELDYECTVKYIKYIPNEIT